MCALLIYPLLIEPQLRLRTQALAWVAGYGAFLTFLAVCAWLVRPSKTESVAEPGTVRAPALGERLHWLALAFVPSSLLYGVTTYLSTDVAAVPLLWLLPLGLYLLTFIVMFARRPAFRQETLLRIFPLAVLAQTFFFAIQELRPLWLLLGLHLLVFFIVALTCHGELARRRPAADHLTEFYLWLSLGGVLAGFFNTLIAPLIFTGMVEYPLVLVVSCLVLPLTPRTDRRWQVSVLDFWLPVVLFLLLTTLGPLAREHIDELPLRVTLLYGLPAAICYAFLHRPLRFALGLAALLGVGGMSGGDRITEVARSRDFFGTLRIVDVQDADHPSARFRRFIHGSTLHGMQRFDPEPDRTPLSYYFRTGPIGQFFAAFAGPRAKRRVAVLGLGAGTLASYAEAGQEWTFFEIDPAVPRQAQEHFTFVSDARERGVTVRIVLGDGRLRLHDVPDHSLGLLFADAFSSDAVPVHLLTREALALYLRKLDEHGLIVVNITNRCLDLEAVLANLAQDLALAARIREEFPSDITVEERQQGKTPSRWVIMARTETDLLELTREQRWRSLQERPAVGVWTDDFSNLFSVFRWLPHERISTAIR
jgi:hypothetical protein